MISQNFILTGTVNSEPKDKGVSYDKKNFNFFLKYDNVEGLILPTGQSNSNTTMFVQYAIPESWGNSGAAEKGKRIIVLGHQDSNAKAAGDVISSVYTKIDTAYPCPEGVTINEASGTGTVDQVKVKENYTVYTISEKKRGPNGGMRLYYMYRPSPKALPIGSLIHWTGHFLSEMFPMPEDATPFQIGKAPMFYASSIVPIKIAK